MFRSLIAFAFAAAATVATAGGTSWSVGISGPGYNISTTNSVRSTQFIVPHHVAPPHHQMHVRPPPPPHHRDPRFGAPQFDRGHHGGYTPGRHHGGRGFNSGYHVAPPVYIPPPVYREYRATRVCEVPSNGGWLIYLNDRFGEMRFSNGYAETCYLNR